MRDYLYIWNDPEKQILTTSGLEFKDFTTLLGQAGGVLLLKSEARSAYSDSGSLLEYFPHSHLDDLVAEDPPSWGDFVWVDYQTWEPCPFPPPLIPPEEVAELLYFAHTGKPLRHIAIPSLNNRFLAHSHDDGWYLQLYYSDWNHVEALLSPQLTEKLGPLNLADLQKGESAFWLSGGQMEEMEKNLDIDVILNERYGTRGGLAI